MRQYFRIREIETGGYTETTQVIGADGVSRVHSQEIPTNTRYVVECAVCGKPVSKDYTRSLLGSALEDIDSYINGHPSYRFYKKDSEKHQACRDEAEAEAAKFRKGQAVG